MLIHSSCGDLRENKIAICVQINAKKKGKKKKSLDVKFCTELPRTLSASQKCLHCCKFNHTNSGKFLSCFLKQSKTLDLDNYYYSLSIGDSIDSTQHATTLVYFFLLFPKWLTLLTKHLPEVCICLHKVKHLTHSTTLLQMHHRNLKHQNQQAFSGYQLTLYYPLNQHNHNNLFQCDI